MRIDYTRKGKVDITMIPYIQNMIEELPEEMAGTSLTPADEAQKLDEEHPSRSTTTQ
jgi:hypothetical protein